MDPSDYENQNEAGYINPRHTKQRTQKIKWSPENDRKLLMVGFGREISNKEYPLIASKIFHKEQPTAKAVQERLTKLRGEQKRILEDLGVTGPSVKLHPLREEDNHDDDDDETNAADTLVDMSRAAAPADESDLDSPSITTSMLAGKKTSKKTNKRPRTSYGASSSLSSFSSINSNNETPDESRARRIAEARKGWNDQKAREKAEETGGDVVEDDEE